MKMFAGRDGMTTASGGREPTFNDLVAFYSKTPGRTVMQRKEGGETIEYRNPGDRMAEQNQFEPETVGTIMTYDRWVVLAPTISIVPGTVVEVEMTNV